MNLLEIRLVPHEIDKKKFSLVAKLTTAEGKNIGEAEGDSNLPFWDGEEDRRSIVIRLLEEYKPYEKNYNHEHMSRDYNDMQKKWIKRTFASSDSLSTFEQVVGNHEANIKKVGFELYRSLLPEGKIRELWARAIYIASKKNTYSSRKHNSSLHLRLCFSDTSVSKSRFADYPWELLHDGKDFLHHRNIYISRYVTYEKEPPEIQPKRAVSILLISPRPRSGNLGSLGNPDRERDIIRKCIEKKSLDLSQPQIKLNKTRISTWSELKNHLDELKIQNRLPDIIHFDGHGHYAKRCSSCEYINDSTIRQKCINCTADLSEPQGFLVFEKYRANSQEEPEPEYISASEFSDLLLNREISLVVLSACQSGMAIVGSSIFNGVAQKIIDTQIPAVIAMQYAVSPDQASNFIGSFYTSLRRRMSLLEAVKEARLAPGIDPQSWYRPVLYLRCQGDNAGYLLEDHFVPRKLSQISIRSLGTIALTSFSSTSLVFLVRFLGIIEVPERLAYDLLFKMQVISPPQEEILVVTIDGDDRLKYGDKEKNISLSPDNLLEFLNALQHLEPTSTGIALSSLSGIEISDINSATNNNYLGSLFFTCAYPNYENDRPEELPPRGVSEAKTGFADIGYDYGDKIVRRTLISFESRSNNQERGCRAPYSFSFTLAQHYLKNHPLGLYKSYKSPQNTEDMCSEIVERFYFSEDIHFSVSSGFGMAFYQLPHYEGRGGCQTLINYRSGNLSEFVDTITLSEVMEGMSPQTLKRYHGRLILVGTIHADGSEHNTPFSQNQPPILIHAHVADQIIREFNSGNGFIRLWSQGQELLWYFVWGVFSSIISFVLFDTQKSRYSKLHLYSLSRLIIYLLFSYLIYFYTIRLWTPVIPGVVNILTVSVLVRISLKKTDE